MTSTAKKFSQGKPKISTIDPDFMDEMAFVLEMGDNKYGDADWMKGMPFSELIDSAERHISKMKRGEYTDEESGQPHAAHVSTCMMMLQFYVRWGQVYEGMNDLRWRRRPPKRKPNLVEVRTMTDPEGYEVPAEEPPYIDPDHIPDEDYDSGFDDLGPAQYHIDPVARFGEINPIRDLQNRIKTWADRVMPNRTAQNALSKLVMEEIPELLNGGLDDPSEWADVIILVMDSANLRGIDVIEAANAKMDINEDSDWTFDPDTGFAKRIKK